MVNTIETGKMYKIYLDQTHWPGISFSVVVSGITNKEAMGNITDYNLKEELFFKFNIGLNTFINMTNCDLYLVQEITDFSTGGISEDIILIPELMIDFKLTERLVELHEFKYNIIGVKRRFTRTKELDNFINNSKVNLVKHLNFLDDFAGEQLAVEVDTSSMYTGESEIKKAEKERRERLTSYTHQKTLTNSANEAVINKAAYNIKKYQELIRDLKTEKSILTYEKDRNQRFYNDTMQVFDANGEYARVLKETHALLKVKAENAGIEWPTYNTILKQAKENIENGIETPMPENPKEEDMQSNSDEKNKE